MRKSILILTLCLLVTAWQTPAFSWNVYEDLLDKIDEKVDDGSVLGGGVLVTQSPYEGIDDSIYAVPIISMETKQFFIDVMTFGYYFNSKEDPVRVGIIGAPRFQGYEDGQGESDLLNGMEDRDWAFDGGLRMKWENDLVDVHMDAVTDLSGKHEGQELRLGLSKQLFDGFLTPRATVGWKSEQLVDYYYGVRPGEARAGRAEYEPDAAMEYTAGLTIGVPLGDVWALVGDVQCNFLTDEITDSPIVDEDTLMSYTLGAVYRF